MLSARFFVLVFALVGCSSVPPAGGPSPSDPRPVAGQTVAVTSVALPRHHAIFTAESVSNLQQMGGSLYWVEGSKIYRRA